MLYIHSILDLVGTGSYVLHVDRSILCTVVGSKFSASSELMAYRRPFAGVGTHDRQIAMPLQQQSSSRARASNARTHHAGTTT